MKKFFAFLRYLKVPGLGKAANVILLAKLKLGLGEPKGGQTALEYLKERGIDGESIKVFWEPFCVSALNTTCAGASAKLMVSTLRKSVLSGGESGILYFPETAVIDAFIPRAVTYLESVGAEICLSDRVEEIEIKNGRFESIKTAKRGRVEFRNCVSALPAKVFANMLPEASALRAEIGDIKSTDIINVYFTTDRKLTDGDYACLVGSKLHWIFDHTRKSKECEKDGTYLYGATISRKYPQILASGTDRHFWQMRNHKGVAFTLPRGDHIRRLRERKGAAGRLPMRSREPAYLRGLGSNGASLHYGKRRKERERHDNF